MTLIEGDGIGPEISQSVKDIFAAAKVSTPSCITSYRLKMSRRPLCGNQLMSRRSSEMGRL